MFLGEKYQIDSIEHFSAETGGKKKKDSRMSLTSTGTGEGDIIDSLKNRRPSGTQLAVRTSQDNLSVGSSSLSGDSSNQQQQQEVAAKLIHWLQTSLVLSHHHLTQYDM